MRMIMQIVIAVLAAQEPVLAPPTAQVFFQDVAWSPDGEWLAFSRYAPDPGSGEYHAEDWSVVVARPDGSEARVVAENAQWVAWSPDGKRLAFASFRDGDWNLYTINLNGSSLERLTSDPANDRAPSWSPDGETIAFTSDRDGNSEIYLLPLDGSGTAERLTSNPADDHNPTWSPDGATLVFYRAAAAGAADQIHEVAADGSEEGRLTDDEHLNIFPAYVPDGRIAWTRKEADGGREGLVVLDRQSAAVAPVGPGGVFFGRWSPDGSRVAMIAGNWPTAAVYVMPADGSAIRKVVN